MSVQSSLTIIMLLDKRRCMAEKNLTFFLCILTASATSGEGPTRSELVHKLLNDTQYDNSLPPEYSTGNVTNVSVQLAITDLDSESDINMEYDCTLYLRLNWTDGRLDFTAYNTSYKRLILGNNIVDKVWIPDLFFYSQRKSEMQGLSTKNQLVYLFENGTIMYSGR
ncbi:gamma-aminobutyric acid receptor subunit beta-4-like [Mercenaria mercenaria]|uniref:gamma-aminobutyric acid receptor subunit beta-4-like n=1 Tax=Mercenaria mercenaria TaxID=6596 RepID=UPI00234EC2C7|nr:gamma-aminobutyric acid receptor subunit beta-4-like [Mercenaria mercenaria]